MHSLKKVFEQMESESIYASIYIYITSIYLHTEKIRSRFYQSINGLMITHALGHMMYDYTLL